MDIKIPRIRIIRPQHYEIVVEKIVMQWLKISFYLSPLAVWKIYELIKPLIEGIK